MAKKKEVKRSFKGELADHISIVEAVIEAAKNSRVKSESLPFWEDIRVVLEDVQVNGLINPPAKAGGNSKKRAEDLQPLQNTHVDCYKDAVAVYLEWYLSTVGIPFSMNGIQGKALKDVLNELKKASKNQDWDGALAGFRFILKYWHTLSSFLQQQKSPVQIRKNLAEILDVLKNGQYNKKEQRKTEMERLKEVLHG